MTNPLTPQGAPELPPLPDFLPTNLCAAMQEWCAAEEGDDAGEAFEHVVTRFGHELRRYANAAVIANRQARQAASEAPRERDRFEAEFPIPAGVEWIGDGYEVEDSYANSYACDRYIARWVGWLSRAALAASEAEAVKVEALRPLTDDELQWQISSVSNNPARFDLEFARRIERLIRDALASTPSPQAAEPMPVEAVSEDTKRMERDAARYRWLCANNFDRQCTQVQTWKQTWEPHSVTGEPTEWTQRIYGAHLDAVIDAAIAASPSSAGGA